MIRHMLKSKIHRAVVTEANQDYVGSLTIDRDLMEAADLLVNEKVQVINLTTGARFETYVIEGKRGSGEICANGGAAQLARAGEKIIIISYCLVEDVEAARHRPRLVFVDELNRPIDPVGVATSSGSSESPYVS